MAGLHFDQTSHAYSLDGSRVPSVTQVIAKAGLIDTTWFTDEARDRGTAVHLAIQYQIEGDLDEKSIDPALTGYLTAWDAFKHDLAIEVLESERRVYSRIYGYAGTLDLLAMVRGMRTVIDFKTGNPGRVAALQTAAYAEALLEVEGQYGALGRLAVWLQPDGSYSLFQYTDRTDIDIFRAALAVVRWKDAA